MRAFRSYAKALDDTGVLANAEVLQRSDLTTTATLAGGELFVQDGPFADSKEQLGEARPGRAALLARSERAQAIPCPRRDEPVRPVDLLAVHDRRAAGS